MSENAEDAAGSLERIADYLMEIASFNRRQELREVLSDPDHRRAYELSDGKRNSGAIAADEKISKSDSAVRGWWVKWRALGMIDDSGEHPRRRYSTFVLDLDEEG